MQIGEMVVRRGMRLPAVEAIRESIRRCWGENYDSCWGMNLDAKDLVISTSHFKIINKAGADTVTFVDFQWPIDSLPINQNLIEAFRAILDGENVTERIATQWRLLHWNETENDFQTEEEQRH